MPQSADTLSPAMEAKIRATVHETVGRIFTAYDRDILPGRIREVIATDLLRGETQDAANKTGQAASADAAPADDADG